MAKTKNGNLKTFVAITSIVLAILMAASAGIKSYYILPIEVTNNAKQFEKDMEANEITHGKLEASIKEVDGECEGLGKDIIEIKTEIKYIRKDMTEILTYIRGLPK